MSYESESLASKIKTTIQTLANRAHVVTTYEAEVARHQATVKSATDRLELAKKQYDETLEKAIDLFPQLATGFNLNPETVGIGADGQVHVVPAEEAS